MATVTSSHSQHGHIEWLVRALTTNELADAEAGIRRANPNLVVRFSMPFLENGQITSRGTDRGYEETPR